jgi:peptidyl-prolyl cis-trans isomerase D
MLTSFRSHIKGWIAWAFVILVSVPFALWGIGNYSSVITSDGVASVNGSEISQQTFQNAYRNAYQQRQKQMDGKFDPTPDQEKALKNQVLNQLVNEALLRQQANKYHMLASEADVQNEIQQIPVFQVNGKFNFQQYRAVLQANNMSTDQYESSVRTNLKSRILQIGLAGSAFATPSAANAMLGLSSEQRKVAWLTLPLSQFKPSKAPSNADIKAWYHDHEKAFTTPTTLAIRYVQLDADALKQSIKPDKQDLLNWYHSNLSQFGTPPARKAAEILIKPEQDNAQGWGAAKKKAGKLLDEVKHSQDAKKKFAELAQKHSDDPVSRRNNGSIGYVGRGQMSEAFDTALFNIDSIDAVAGPVRTDDGWVLLQLLKKRSGKVKPYADVKDKVKEKYLQSKASERYYDEGEKLANLAFEHSGSLEQISKKLNLKVKTVKDVTRNKGAGIARHDEIRKAAFSGDVLKKHQNSEPVKLGDLNVVVLRVTDVQPSKLQPLTAVHDQIVAALQQSRAKHAADQAADHAVSELQDGKHFDQVADTLNVKASGPATITRAALAASVPAPVARAAFDKPVPAHGKALYGRATLDNGEPVLFALLNVTRNNKQDVKPQQRQAYVAQLSRMHANEEMNAYVAWLRKQADVKINKDKLP